MSNSPPGQNTQAAFRPSTLPGTLVAGKYRIDKQLGQGGMGVVLAATHEELGDLVAMKVLSSEASLSEVNVERFLREARAAVRIKNEHVARVLDMGRMASGQPFIVMEYLNGHDLSQLIASGSRLPMDQAADYIIQASVGLAEAHHLGIVHRDIKPSNLFIHGQSDGSNIIKILDFGISKLTAESSANERNLTQSQYVFGTPTYMSPEQIRSTRSVDARTDVWSLGVVLFELLTGRPPFGGESLQGMLASIVADEPTPLRALRPDVPVAFEAVVMRCLEKDVTKRWQSVADLAVALQPFSTTTSFHSVDRIVRLSSGQISKPMLTPSLLPPRSTMALAATQDALTLSTQTKKSRTRATFIAAVAGFLSVIGVWVAWQSPWSRSAVGAHNPPTATASSPATPGTFLSGSSGAEQGSTAALPTAPLPSSSSATKPAFPQPSADPRSETAAASPRNDDEGDDPADAVRPKEPQDRSSKPSKGDNARSKRRTDRRDAKPSGEAAPAPNAAPTPSPAARPSAPSDPLSDQF